MSAHRRPAKPATAAGVPIAVDPIAATAATAKPSKLAVYAKAVAAFLGAELVAIATWGMALSDGPIDRVAWFGLALAVAGPFVLAGGVAAIKNAPKPTTDSEAGYSLVELLIAVLIIAVLVWLAVFIAHQS